MFHWTLMMEKLGETTLTYYKDTTSIYLRTQNTMICQTTINLLTVDYYIHSNSASTAGSLTNPPSYLNTFLPSQHPPNAWLPVAITLDRPIGSIPGSSSLQAVWWDGCRVLTQHVEAFLGKFGILLLMVQKSGGHQLRLVVYIPLFTTGLINPRWLAGFLNHQQYFHPFGKFGM